MKVGKGFIQHILLPKPLANLQNAGSASKHFALCTPRHIDCSVAHASIFILRFHVFEACSTCGVLMKPLEPGRNLS
jgi:hypothetical protein